jgi:hypothetical protein
MPAPPQTLIPAETLIEIGMIAAHHYSIPPCDVRISPTPTATVIFTLPPSTSTTLHRHIIPLAEQFRTKTLTFSAGHSPQAHILALHLHRNPEPVISQFRLRELISPEILIKIGMDAAHRYAIPPCDVHISAFTPIEIQDPPNRNPRYIYIVPLETIIRYNNLVLAMGYLPDTNTLGLYIPSP